MKYSDTEKLSDKDLVHYELGLERKLVEATFKLSTGQLDDTSTVGKLRKDIARARTAQRSRERSQNLGKNALRDQHRSTFDPTAAAPTADSADSSKGFLQGIADRLGLGGGEEAAAE